MNNECYQTVISEINESYTVKSFMLENIQTTSNANFFFLFSNIYDEKDNIKTSVFDICEDISTNYGLFLQNIIVAPQAAHKYLEDNILYILWFVKDKNNIFFDKDRIREKHIWKDAEWGKREKNYHPIGKDPGNVWITTEDNGKGKIIKHNILSKKEVINRCLVSSKKDTDKAIIIAKNIDFSFDKLSNITVKELPSKQINVGCKELNIDCNPMMISNEIVKSKVIFSTSESMFHVVDNSVNAIITSPPYWDLKNYFKEGQIGQESYETYLDRIKKVWQETYRILDNRGSFWVNINTRSKNKRFLLIPQDIIKQCLNIGYKLKRIIIWHKSSGIPTTSQNLVDRFEYFLWFTKGDTPLINSYPLATEYKESNLYKGISWNINRRAGSVGKDLVHPAVYPTELIERIINLTTHKNDTVLDPFLGSGTTIVAAIKNGRNGIGYEFNEGFIDLIKYVFDSNNLNIDEIEMKKDKDLSTNGIFRESLK